MHQHAFKNQPEHNIGNTILTFGTRLLVWGVLFWILYILRSFFLLIFLTFVFAYLQASGIKRLEKFIKIRTVRVILVAGIILTSLILTGIYIFPKVKTQTEVFFNQFSTYMVRVDQELYGLGDHYPMMRDALPGMIPDRPLNPADVKKDLKNSPTFVLLEKTFGFTDEDEGSHKMDQLITTFKGISGNVVAITSAFLLSLLFSFLIVLDMPSLSRSVADLEYTKIRFIYQEVSENIREFATVLGRSLEAQLFIAIMNSFLTAAGLYGLGFGNSIAFLSMITFFCSFIPVAGIFISSIPISLIALQNLGLQTMFLSLAWIAFIHMVEGYVLNPKVYGSFMRINPVIVLIILTIGGKLFNLWGLVLGVPICTYIFGYAIRFKEPVKEELIVE